jgi:hypothetical protein
VWCRGVCFPVAAASSSSDKPQADAGAAAASSSSDKPQADAGAEEDDANDVQDLAKVFCPTKGCDNAGLGVLVAPGADFSCGACLGTFRVTEDNKVVQEVDADLPDKKKTHVTAPSGLFAQPPAGSRKHAAVVNGSSDKWTIDESLNLLHVLHWHVMGQGHGEQDKMGKMSVRDVISQSRLSVKEILKKNTKRFKGVENPFMTILGWDFEPGMSNRTDSAMASHQTRIRGKISDALNKAMNPTREPKGGWPRKASGAVGKICEYWGPMFAAALI